MGDNADLLDVPVPWTTQPETYMKRSRRLLWGVIVVCVALPVSAQQDPRSAGAPILVQGAMASETDRLVSHIDGARAEQIGGWRFWVGTLDGYPVVVSRTNKG